MFSNNVPYSASYWLYLGSVVEQVFKVPNVFAREVCHRINGSKLRTGPKSDVYDCLVYVVVSYCCLRYTVSVIVYLIIVGREWRREEVTCYPETRDHRRDMRSDGCHGDHRSSARCQIPLGQRQ